MGGTANGQLLVQQDLFGAGSTVDQTLTGNLVLVDNDQSGQFIDCNGSNRTCQLPATSSANHYFAIVNVTASAYNVTILAPDGMTTITTLGPGVGSIFISDGNQWRATNTLNVTGANPIALSVITAEVTVASSNAENNLASVTIPGGTLSTNNILRIRAWCRWLNNAGAGTQTTTYRIKYGGTLLASLIVSNGSSTAYIIAEIIATIKGNTATNSQKGFGIILPAVESGFSLASTSLNSATNTSAINSTVDQTLLLTEQHSLSNASMSTTLLSMSIEKLTAV